MSPKSSWNNRRKSRRLSGDRYPDEDVNPICYVATLFFSSYFSLFFIHFFPLFFSPTCSLFLYFLLSYLSFGVNPLNAELNPICYLLALLGAHHFLHVSRIRVKSLIFMLLMSYIYIYIYGAPILDVSRSHTTTQHSR